MFTLELRRRGEVLCARLVAREKQIAATAEPHVHAHLGGEVGAELEGLLHQADVRVARPLRAQSAAVASRRARTEIAALDDDDASEAELREVERRRQAHDPRADDHHVGRLGQVLGILRETLLCRRRTAHSSSTKPARSASGIGCSGGRGVMGSAGGSPPRATMSRAQSATHCLP